MTTTWRRVVKLDPEREHSPGQLQALCDWPIDALILGGTWGVTQRNATDLALAVRKQRYRRPLWQEVSEGDGLAFGVDGYLIPIVLNAGDVEYVVRAQVRAIRSYGDMIAWRYVVPVGYIVMHDDCAVARRTRADIPRDVQDVLAYAAYGAHLCGLRRIYIEYSGRIGDPAIPEAVRRAHAEQQVFYGGGLATRADADLYLQHASTVVIGNALYEADLSDRAACPF